MGGATAPRLRFHLQDHQIHCSLPEAVKNQMLMFINTIEDQPAGKTGYAPGANTWRGKVFSSSPKQGVFLQLAEGFLQGLIPGCRHVGPGLVLQPG